MKRPLITNLFLAGHSNHCSNRSPDDEVLLLLLLLLLLLPPPRPVLRVQRRCAHGRVADDARVDRDRGVILIGPFGLIFPFTVVLGCLFLVLVEFDSPLESSFPEAPHGDLLLPADGRGGGQQGLLRRGVKGVHADVAWKKVFGRLNFTVKRELIRLLF